MLMQAAPFLFCVLWLLVCARLYLMISRENVMQRRLIAIGAGLGAGLIYIVATLLLSFFSATTQEPPPATDSDLEFRVQRKIPKDGL